MARTGNRNFKPSVCLLEDRTLPSGFRVITGPAAANLMVLAPQQVQAGQNFNVEVEAVTKGGLRSTGFSGPVELTLGGSVLATYTFSAADHGVHVFQVKLTTAGSQTIGALDTAVGSTIGGGAYTTVMPGTATQLEVMGPSTANVGMPTSVTVEALDAYGNVATNFTGAVRLSGADADLPASYMFTVGDEGMHTFSVAFTSAGTQTITAAGAMMTTGSASVDVTAGGYGSYGSYYGTYNPISGTYSPYYGSYSPYYGAYNPYYGWRGYWW